MLEDVKELERIVVDGQARELEVNGRKLVFGKFQEVKPIKNYYKKVEFNELSSLVTMIEKEWEKDRGQLFINVESPFKVSTFTKVDVELERQEPYEVSFIGKQFDFGKWLDYENFIISLRALFIETEERDKLLNLIASIKNVDNNEISDNGITQTATTKKGAILEKGELKAIYNLTPYRTFRDVLQVSSEYLFRISQARGELSFALFTADGENWRKSQKSIIEYYLSEALKSKIVSGEVVVVS